MQPSSNLIITQYRQYLEQLRQPPRKTPDMLLVEANGIVRRKPAQQADGTALLRIILRQNQANRIATQQ